MEYKNLSHTFEPVYNENSKILILGTFPSVKSRENQFYYGNNQNRFWRVIASITNSSVPKTTESKKEMLLSNNIAVWDVIASCDIIGSSDSSIKNVSVNDINTILKASPIKKIFANGTKAYDLYMKYIYSDTKREIFKLPSTSPANASYNFEKLCSAWSKILV